MARHPLSGICRVDTDPVSRFVECPHCPWKAKLPRGNALAVNIKLLAAAGKHFKEVHPKEWIKHFGQRKVSARGNVRRIKQKDLPRISCGRCGGQVKWERCKIEEDGSKWDGWQFPRVCEHCGYDGRKDDAVAGSIQVTLEE